MVPVHSALTLCYGECAAFGGHRRDGRTDARPLPLEADDSRGAPTTGQATPVASGLPRDTEEARVRVRPVLSEDRERLGPGLKAYRIITPRLPR